jgi:hypothetical protein
MWELLKGSTVLISQYDCLCWLSLCAHTISFSHPMNNICLSVTRMFWYDVHWSSKEEYLSLLSECFHTTSSNHPRKNMSLSYQNTFIRLPSIISIIFNLSVILVFYTTSSNQPSTKRRISVSQLSESLFSTEDELCEHCNTFLTLRLTGCVSKVFSWGNGTFFYWCIRKDISCMKFRHS